MEVFELQEEIQALQDLSAYEFPGDQDVPSMDPRAVAILLEGAVEAVADSSDAITDSAVFDTYRSILKYAEHVQGTTMSKLLDSISSGFQAQVDATLRDNGDDDPDTLASRKQTLEMYAFLVHWFVLAAERVKGGDEEDAPAPPPKAKRGRGGKAAASRAAAARRVEQWSWQGHIPGILSLISKIFKIKTQRIWVTTGERDTFIKCDPRLLDIQTSFFDVYYQLCYLTGIPNYGERRLHESRTNSDGCLQSHIARSQAPWSRCFRSDFHHAKFAILRPPS